MDQIFTHGGRRAGAGRPKGAVNRRSAALAEQMLSAGNCPAAALARLAQEAEAAGKLSLAIEAWKALLPYVHPRPKAVESDPEGVVALQGDLLDLRRGAAAEENAGYDRALAAAEARLRPS